MLGYLFKNVYFYIMIGLGVATAVLAVTVGKSSTIVGAACNNLFY